MTKAETTNSTDVDLLASHVEMARLRAEAEAIALQNDTLDSDPRHESIFAAMDRLQDAVNATPAADLKTLRAKILTLSAADPKFDNDMNRAALISIVRDAEQLAA